MWNVRAIIPDTLRKQLLSELHQGHVDIVKMKRLARSYVWWPGIDKDIEEIAKNCIACQRNPNDPPKALIHSWEWPLR